MLYNLVQSCTKYYAEMGEYEIHEDELYDKYFMSVRGDAI